MNEVDKEAERAAIRQLLVDSTEAENRRDAEKYLTYFHEDLVSLPPGMPITEGLQFMRDAVDEAFNLLAIYEYEVTHLDVSDSGDMGYVVANYRMVLDGPDGRIEDIGKYHSTFKKKDGEWKFVVQSWNNNSAE